MISSDIDASSLQSFIQCKPFYNSVTEADSGKKIWDDLNELAIKDPVAYKMQLKQKIDAMQAPQTPTKLVMPGLVIETQGSMYLGVCNYRINLAHSEAMKASVDAIEIPILISQLRVVVTKDSKANVFDAVLNSATYAESLRDKSLQDSLIQLALSCIEESFGVKLDKNSYVIYLSLSYKNFILSSMLIKALMAGERMEYPLITSKHMSSNPE